MRRLRAVFAFLVALSMGAALPACNTNGGIPAMTAPHAGGSPSPSPTPSRKPGSAAFGNRAHVRGPLP